MTKAAKQPAPSLKYVEGDMFAPLKDGSEKGPVVLPHVCNDKGGFGAGFVVPLSRNYPIVQSQYMQWANKGNDVAATFELGHTQFVCVNPLPVDSEGGCSPLFVANMLAQTLGGSRPLYYNHLVSCMNAVAKFALEHQARIIAPAFGAGLAGGDWRFIEKLIEDCWIKSGLNVTIYYLESTRPEGLNP